MRTLRGCWLLLGLVASGCGQDGPPDDWFSRYPWPIVDGYRETGQLPVVMIYNDRGAGCTASVIAPRVALTAKHCVLGMPASGWHVLVGGSIYSAIDEYRVTETRTTAGTSIEERDIAVMILNRDFVHGFKRWEFLPWPGVRAGAEITAIGYGQTDPNNPNSAGTKYRRNGYIVTILGAEEFVTRGENTCQGDSGGPILFQDVVTGIVSRGEEGCTGMGIMTRVSAFADLVNQALRDTGACVPVQFEVCNRLDDDCWNGPDDGLGPLCACSDGAPPAGPEVCNGRDDDCNAAVDDLPNCACTGGAPPGAETCNGVDDDCNGVIDDPCRRLGESCATDGECSTGLCADLGAGRVCTANCTATGASSCPDGGYCDALACGAGMCRLAADGGAAPLGAPCAASGECASRFCAPLPTGATVCARPCTPGALSCFAREACLGVAGACGACVEVADAPPPRGFGEPCAVDADCLSGLCFTDGDPTRCGAECSYRYCAESCGSAGECPDGAHCRDGVCVRGPRSELGETCLSDADCVAGICEPAGHGLYRCVDECTPEGTCSNPGYSCIAGTCRSDALRPGDPCAAWEDFCEGGWCTDVGGRLVCVSGCNDAGDCESGLVCVPEPEGAGGICVPASATFAGGDDGCGCAVPARAGRSDVCVGLVLVAGLLAFRLTRRRRPR